MVTVIVPFMWGRVSTCVRPCRLRLAGVTQAITHAPTVTAMYGMGYPVPYYYRYPYGVYYRGYYASPGIHISVRL